MKIQLRSAMAIALLGLSSAIAIPMAASAESLADGDIKSMYSEMDAAVRDGDKTAKIMQTRLGDEFAVNTQSSLTVGNNPTYTTLDSAKKAQIVGAIPTLYSTIKVGDAKRSIIDIKYSADKKWAYVSQTLKTDGKIYSAPNNPQATSFNYGAVTSCVDTLTLRNSVVTIVKSDCKTQTGVTPGQ